MAAPALQGSELQDSWTGTPHTTAALVWGASVADLLLTVSIAIVANNNVIPTVTSVTDSLGLTWTKRASIGQIGITSGITSGPVAQGMEIWTAPAPGSPTWTGHTITVASSANTDSVVMAMERLNAANLSTPMDHNASFPKTATRNTTGTLSATGISTSTANCTVYAMRCAAGAGNNINTGTFHIAGVNGDFGTATLKNGTNFCIAGSQGKGFTSTQSGIAVDSGTTTDDAMIVAIGITGDSQPALPSRSWGRVIS